MQNIQIMPFIKDKLGVMVLTGIFLAAVSFLFVVVSQKNFKVGTDFLIVQDKDGNQDYYSISKSTEYIGRIFGEVIYSDLFIEEVIKTGKINSEFLPFDKKTRLEEWNDIVRVSRNPEVSMMSVSVMADNQGDAVRIAEGISEVLVTKSYLFRGSGVNVDVRVTSGPIVEKNPSFSQIVLVIFGGFLLGALISIIWNYYCYNPEKEYEKMVSLAKRKESVYNYPAGDEYEESLRQMERR